MPSPFPGMDPFIEASGLWGDFHVSLIVTMRGILNTKLPARFVAAGDRHVWLEETDSASRSPRDPDVFVTDHGPAGRATRPRGVLTAPATVILPAVRRQGPRFLKIVDREDRRIVTAIEVLSPANKSGRDRKAYLAKRKEYFAAGVNLVEIDLLRRGKRLPLGSPAPSVADYYVLVCPHTELPRAGLWAIGLRDPLPDLPIPLTLDTGSVTLPLRDCLDRVYDEGRYSTAVNYHERLLPPVEEADAAWISKLLARQERLQQ